MARALLIGVLVMVAVGVPGAARAQEQSGGDRPSSVRDLFGISGSVRAGYWSSTRELDSEQHLGVAILWLKATRPLSDRVSYLFEGRVHLMGPIERTKTSTVAREAFVQLHLGKLDVRAGRQIIAWGRADGINPTDNLTGEDLTLLVTDDDDRRLGATAVRASYYLGDVSVTGIWLPESAPHRFPLPQMPGLAFHSTWQRWSSDAWAARVEQTGRAVDWSASYYRGPDLLPDLSPAAASQPAVRLSHHPVQVFGADMAANLGRFGLRAEAAFFKTADDDGRDPYTKNPYLFVVAGADRTFREHLNLNVQYLHRSVFHVRPVDGNASELERAVAMQQSVLASETRRVQHGASFRLAYKWLHDTLEAECSAAGWFGPRGLVIRPRLSYAVSDHWKITGGAEWYNGETLSMFSLLQTNSTVFFEVRRGF